MGLTLVLASCAAQAPRPSASKLDAGCEAMRPFMPIKFHGNDDTASTIGQVRNANAAFRSACP